METILKLVLGYSVLTLLFLTSSAQTCKNMTFPTSHPNNNFSTCLDLPHLSSYLHWNYNQSTGKLDVAYRHTNVTSNNKWVAWGLNPTGSASSAMIGAQTLVAIVGSNGTVKAYTAPISSYGTTLAEGTLSFPVTGLNVTYENSEVIIYATITLTSGVSSMVHAWQEGDMSGSTPQAHSMASANINSQGTLNLV